MTGIVPRMTRKRAETVRNPDFPSIPQENVIGGGVFRGAIFKLAPRIVVFLVSEIIFLGAISKIAPGFVFPLTGKIVFRGAISEIAPENLRPLIRNVLFLSQDSFFPWRYFENSATIFSSFINQNSSANRSF